MDGFEARVDDKGRITLPAQWLSFYMHDLKETSVWVTSLDGEVIRIYPDSAWQINRIKMSADPEIRGAWQKMQRMAQYYGERTTLTAAGKVMIKKELRDDLQIVSKKIVGVGNDGVIHVYKEEAFKAQLAEYKQTAKAMEDTLTTKGLL